MRSGIEQLDAAEIAARLARISSLESGADEMAPSTPSVDAAVLVPLINRASMSLLFTQRAAHLKAHAGQASFPGGRREPADRSLIDTALRETEEEVGLDRSQVQVLGQLPPYRTVTGFRVTPIVGWIEPELQLTLDPGEVDRVFEIPLAIALSPSHLIRQSAIYKGKRRHYHVVKHEDNVVWGATAGMLLSLQEALWQFA